MLDGKEIIEKLYLLASEFNVHMQNKEYVRAKSCYDTAVNVAVFCEVESKYMDELFGIRGERGVIIKPGLFPEEKVIRAYGECIKRHQTHENKQYEPIKRQKYSA